jgi:Domain of unknown function (DUF1905)
MRPTRVSFTAEVWEHDGPGAWYFISLPEQDADHIDAIAADRRRGFGSVRVEATIGGTRWSTSIFPDRRRQTYLLPLKKAVRVSEALTAGSTARVELLILHS